MAKKSPRIEPSFDDAPRTKRGGGLAATEDDRVAAPRRKTRAKKSRRGGSFGLLGRLAYWGFVLMLWCGIGVAGLVAYYGARMPAATTWAIPDRPPNVKIVSVDGELIANRGATGGEAVELKDMSPYIPQAVVAIEDRRFYSHFGVDPQGLARAMVRNVMAGRMTQGGSTLTQQLAKNLFLSPDRTLERKVQELLLAFWLEAEYTKDQILEMYLNRVYFGSGAHGVEAAARRYFNKSARDVSLQEAAVLAAVLKAPSRFSPAKDPKAAESRAELVIAAMREQGMIGDREMTAALSAKAKRPPSYWTGSEHYVADRVMDDLPEIVGEIREDVIVDTTIDLSLQKLGEQAIRKLVKDNGPKLNVSQGALVSLDGSGAVRALVGGVDYSGSQFDRAGTAKRQPGSAFKPFVYLAALENGMTPQTRVTDAPVRIGKWRPENYGGKYYGEVTLTTALSKSLNSVAAQLAVKAGPANVVETAHRLGVESALEANASIALGTSDVSLMELTAAYAPFANGGWRPDAHIVTRVTTVSGKVLYEHEKRDAPRVVSPEHVAMMNAMMAETIRSGTATKAAFGWPAAGKTGTSQNSRDAWFVGYTSNLVTGVWFGNDDGKPTKNVTGGSLPALAWKTFMTAAHDGVEVAELPGRWTPSTPGFPEAPAYPEQTTARDKPAEPLPVAMPSPKPAAKAKPAKPAAEVAARPAPAKKPATKRPADDPTTASVPRPKADVGGGKAKTEKTLVDIILGD